MKRAFLIGLLLALSAACATVGEKERANARLHYDIGVTAMNSGDLRQALRELLSAVDLDPELAQAHNALGLVYLALGRMDDSLAHYRKALKLDPKFSEAYNNYGAALIEVGRYDEAIAAFKKALSDILYATPALAEGNMGWAYYKKGDVERAVRHLRNAVATGPNFCRGYDWLAEIELGRHRPEQAVAYCKRFEKYCLGDAKVARTLPHPFVVEMQYMLGRGYLEMGDRDRARETLSKCARGADETGEEDPGARCARALKDLD